MREQRKRAETYVLRALCSECDSEMKLVGMGGPKFLKIEATTYSYRCPDCGSAATSNKQYPSIHHKEVGDEVQDD